MDREPTRQKADEALEDAVRAFVAWRRLAVRHEVIVWTLLAESSPHHYHVWALFARPLTRDEHHALVHEARRTHGPLANLDKDSTRAEGRFGDQFRAPWTWKRGRRFEAIESWVRDEGLALRVGEEAKPGGTVGRAAPEAPPDAPDPDSVADYAIHNFPIERGTRNASKRDLVATLVGRVFDEHLIGQAGRRWLEHFRDRMNTSLERAVALFDDCVRRTLANPKFTPAESPDYARLCKDAVLSPCQVRLLDSRLSAACLPSLDTGEFGGEERVCHPLLDQVRDDRGQVREDRVKVREDRDQVREDRSRVREDRVKVREDRDQVREDRGQEWEGRDRVKEDRSPSDELLCEGEQERCFVEALVVLCTIERGKVRRESAEGRVRLTHRQIIEVVRSRHGRDLHPRQVQRLKARYVRFSGKGRWHAATRCELLVETLKGVKGIASEYQLSPAMRGLFGPTGVDDGPGPVRTRDASQQSLEAAQTAAII